MVELTDKEKLGYIAESVVNSTLKAVCNSLGLTVVWSGKSAYGKLTNKERHDADFKIYYGYRLLKVYETKNWKTLSHRLYDSYTANKEVISRVAEYGCSTGLIVSNFGVFNPVAQRIIESRYNSVIETGKLLGSKDFKGSTYGKLYRELYGDLKETVDREVAYQKHVQTELAKFIQPKVQPNPEADIFVNYQLQLITINNTTNNNNNTINNNKEITNTPVNEIDSNELDNDKLSDQIEELDVNSEVERAKKLGLYYGFDD
ncbi:MAG: hypothetical protein NWE98_10155 [Candidatus Bathyarchaeota archaeon]|nr:hypothetical protein [Candidatus Bathyarchaeota archaeon]